MVLLCTLTQRCRVVWWCLKRYRRVQWVSIRVIRAPVQAYSQCHADTLLAQIL